MLKASLAGERTQFSHITEVLEATTGSTEEVTIGDNWVHAEFSGIKILSGQCCTDNHMVLCSFPARTQPYVGSWGSCILRLMPSPELLPMVSTVWKALDTLGERSQSIDTFIRELQEHREVTLSSMLSRMPRRVSVVLN